MDEIVINTRIDTSGIDKGIEEIKQKLSGLSDVTADVGVNLTGAIEDSATDIQGVVDGLADRIEMFFTDFVEGLTEGLGEAYEETEQRATEASESIDDLTGRLDTNVRAIANTTANIEEYLNAMGGVHVQSENVGKSTNRLGRFLASVGSAVKGIGAKLTEPIKKVGVFAKRFLSIGGAILIFKKLTSQIKGAMSSLEGWGTQTSRLISDYKKSMEYVQNAMGAMFAPIIDTVLPRIISLLDRVAEMFNKIGMIIAAMLGKKTYTKAVKGVNDYKDAIAKTGAAADKASGSLAAFDELTIIDTPQEQEQNPFVETAIPEEILQIKSLKDLIESIDWAGLGDKAASFVNNLVSNIKEKIEKFPAEELGEALKELTISFIKNVDFKNMGDTFGEFVGKIAEGIKSYFSPDENGDTVVGVLAQGVKDFLIGAIDGVDPSALGETWATIANAIVDGLIKFFDPKENLFSKLVQAIYEFVSGALGKLDFESVREAVSNIATTIVDALSTAVKKFPASQLATSLSDFIWNAVSGLTDGLEDFDPIDFIDGITDKIIEFVENIKWFEVGGALMKCVTTIVTMIPEILITMVDTPIRLLVKGLSDFLYNIGAKMAQSNIPWIRDLGNDIKGFALDVEDAYDTASENIKDAVHTAMSDARKDANDTIDQWVADQEIAYQKTEAMREYDKKNRELMKNETVGITQEEAMELERIRQAGVESVRKAEKEKADLMTSATKDTSAVVLEENNKVKTSYKEVTTTEKTSTGESIKVLHGYSQTVSKVTGEVVSANHGAGTSFGELEKTTSQKMGAMSSSVMRGAAGVQRDVASKFASANVSASTQMNSMSSNTSGKMSSILSTVQSKASSMASVMASKLGTMSSDLSSKMSTMSSNASTKFSSISSTVQTKVGTMASTMQSKLSGMSSTLTSKLSTMASSTSTKFSSIVSTVQTKASSMASTLSSKLGGMSTTLSTKFQSMLGTVQNKATMMVSSFNGTNWASVGSNMVSGIVSGINGGWSWLTSTVSSLASSALTAAKKALKIKSPSRAFRDEVGKMVPEGMALGIEDEADAPIRAMNDIASSLMDTTVGTLQAPFVANGSTLPTQIESNLARADYNDEDSSAVNIDDLINMVRQVRDNQQDLLETLITAVRTKQFSFIPNASNGRYIDLSLRAYRGVTG